MPCHGRGGDQPVRDLEATASGLSRSTQVQGQASRSEAG